jgi:enamine deaminase RidA (YjgF/YER057c/UK114 family)
MVYTSGALGVTPDGKMVEGPIEGRVSQILDNLEAVLKAHGSGLEHIVKSLIFVRPPTCLLTQIYTARMPKPPPARSCIGAATLPRGTDIEIEVIARIPGSKESAKL